MSFGPGLWIQQPIDFLFNFGYEYNILVCFQQGHFFMMAAEIVIISSELNWAREKEILGFFYYPQYLVSKIASQVIHGENFFFHFAF